MNNLKYEIFDPKVDGPLHLKTRKEAQKHFELYVSSIDDRLGQLMKLIDKVELDYSDGSVKLLEDWFVANCKIDIKSAENLDLLTYSICNDVSLYLGDLLIKKNPKIHWGLNTLKPTDVSYHRPVLIGFNKKIKDYYIDLDLILCQYAFRVVSTGINENLFDRLIESALKRF